MKRIPMAMIVIFYPFSEPELLTTFEGYYYLNVDNFDI